MKQKDWFSSWFNTPYYHILYKDRNDGEAQNFMRNITSFLQLKQGAHILDLPCGKGRHAIFLNSLGYKVTGADLSKNSIAYAKQFENNTLYFKVKDMRELFKNKYDAIFNLFTSFGYFDKNTDDVLVLQNMKKGVRASGPLVLDFLNVELVKKQLIPYEEKVIDGIKFRISKEIRDGFILKHIHFTDKDTPYNFTEKVKYIDLPKFEILFKKAGFTLRHIFGDYQLSKFNPKTSERLIFVAQ